MKVTLFSEWWVRYIVNGGTVICGVDWDAEVVERYERVWRGRDKGITRAWSVCKLNMGVRYEGVSPAQARILLHEFALSPTLIIGKLTGKERKEACLTKGSLLLTRRKESEASQRRARYVLWITLTLRSWNTEGKPNLKESLISRTNPPDRVINRIMLRVTFCPCRIMPWLPLTTR